MKINIAGIHNFSEFDIHMESRINSHSPNILLARKCLYDGKAIIEEEFPYRDFYNPIRDFAGHKEKIIEQNTDYVVKSMGYTRFHDMVIESDADRLVFFTKQAELTSLNGIVISIAKDFDRIYLVISDQYDSILQRIAISSGKKSDHLADFYITVSEKDGFLIEPMSRNVRDSLLSFYKIAGRLMEFFEGKTTNVRFRISEDQLNSFTMFRDADLLQSVAPKGSSDQDAEDMTLLPVRLYFSNEGEGKAYTDADGYLNEYESTMKSPQTVPTVMKNGQRKGMGLIKIKLLLKDFVFKSENLTIQLGIRLNHTHWVVNPKAAGMHTIVKWSVDTDVNHAIDQSNGLLTLDQNSPDRPLTVIAEISIQLEIQIDSDSAPLFISREGKDLPWAYDERGQEALRMFYLFYNRLTPETRLLLSKLPTHRALDKNENEGYNPFTNTIVISDETLKKGKHEILYVFSKYYSEAIVTNYVTDNRKIVSDVFGTIFNYMSVTSANPLPIGANSFVPVIVFPTAFFTFIADYMTQYLSFRKDIVSEFSLATNWVMHNFTMVNFPVIGWFVKLLSTAPPHYIFSFAASINPILKIYLGMRNTDLSGDKWKKAGMPESEALKGPIQDLCASLATLGMREEVLKNISDRELQIPDKARTDFLREKFTKEEDSISEADLSFYDELLIGTDHFNIATDAVHTTSMNKLHNTEHLMNTLAARWESVNTREFEKNQLILTEVYRNHSKEMEKEIGVARVLETYGNGLQPYESHEHPVSNGHILFDGEVMVENTSGKGIWMVSQTNDKTKQLMQLSGYLNLNDRLGRSDFRKRYDELHFHWSSHAKKRSWRKERHSKAYKDIDSVMTKLISLWGEAEDESGIRNLGDKGGFFMEFLKIAEIRAESIPIAEKPTYQDIKNYLNLTGKGLNLYDEDENTIETGDLIVPYHENTIGIVTRVRSNSAVDVLMSGGWEREKDHRKGIGEPVKVVKLLHQYETGLIKYLWKPDAKPRDFTARDK
ncbi:MAG: hypothetical protein WBA74_11965 [Cyclobacteriaceae bacterium]